MSAEKLAVVEAQVAGCTKCPLCETRNNIVFGVGNPDARIMFIGEGPGKNEDLQGEPFVGAAGKLLNEMFVEAGLKREDIYIANILKCRPPQNRDPKPDEIEVCTPYLRDQIRAIHPDILVTLGNFATKFVLKTDRGITGLRGHIYVTGRFRVLPTYHPAATIYDQSKRADLISDFKLLACMLEVDEERAAQASQEEGTK